MAANLAARGKSGLRRPEIVMLYYLTKLYSVHDLPVGGATSLHEAPRMGNSIHHYIPRNLLDDIQNR